MAWAGGAKLVPFDVEGSPIWRDRVSTLVAARAKEMRSTPCRQRDGSLEARHPCSCAASRMANSIRSASNDVRGRRRELVEPVERGGNRDRARRCVRQLSLGLQRTLGLLHRVWLHLRNEMRRLLLAPRRTTILSRAMCAARPHGLRARRIVMRTA